jgi:hypothetical protein
MVLGLAALVAVPAAVALAWRSTGFGLLDASFAIPPAMICGLAALLFVRGARGRIRSTLERAGGAGRIRIGRFLAIAGISIALSASIAVGFYELLLRLEG